MHAQSLKDLLNNLNLKDATEDILDNLGILPKDIAGTWEYTGSAVEFTSDNAIMSATSGLVSSQIEEKLNVYLEKIGLRQGTFSYEFKTDSTFTTTFNKMKFPGTYSFSEEAGTIILDYGATDRLKGFSITTQASLSSSELNLMFNADKILEFLSKISSSTGESSLSLLTSLVDQYDGLKIGFKLTKQSTPTH